MTMTNENMQKIATLLTSDEPSFVEQGLLLIETLIDREVDLLAIFTLIFETIPAAEDASLDDFSYHLSTYHSLWLLGIWAGLNSHVLSKNTTIDLGWKRLSVLPESIGNLTNLTKLDLGGKGLTNLPDSLGNLYNLTELNLSENQLTTLPESIGKLTSLTALHLGENQLTTLPKSIGNLTNLGEFVFNWQTISSVPQSIGNIKCITHLDLSERKQTSWPQGIEYLTHLTHLSLERCGLSILPTAIPKLTRLRLLDLSLNQLTTLPENIGNLVNLTQLDILFNDLESLDENFGNLTNLVSLNLHGNQLTTLPKNVGNLVHLKKLDLFNNNLVRLPKSIGNLTNLIELDINANPLMELPKELMAISTLTYLHFHPRDLSLCALRKLNPYALEFLHKIDRYRRYTPIDKFFDRDQRIWVQTVLIKHSHDKAHNSTIVVDIEEWQRFQEDICELTNLKHLTITPGDSGQTLSAFPEGIFKLTGLETLTLQNHDITTIPHGIRHLNSLRTLDLSRNPISIDNPAELPLNTPVKSAFKNIMYHGDYHSKYRVMMCVNSPNELCEITGMTRPKSYNHAKRISGYARKRTQHSILRLLTLLKASVIEDASWLGQVTELDLQGGHLSVLPPEILRLPKLQHLNLSNNQLTSLPANLGTALPQTSVDLRWNPLESLSTNLASIRLNREQWTQFADQIIAEGTIRTLDIRNNRLGCFPSALLRLTSLTALNIAGNNLTELPDLSPLSNLRLLNLSNNELTQPDLTGLTSLNQLDLRDNPLNGIPVGINTLSALNKVRVNQIEAEPSDILGCHGITRGLFQAMVSNDVTTRLFEHLSTLSLTSAPDLCSLLGIECPDTYTAWTNLEAPTAIKALILNLLSNEQDSWLQHTTQLSLIDFGLTQWPDWLQRCTQLESLSLAYNDLTTLPSWLHALNQLTELSVLENPRFTLDRTLIPEQLVNLNLVGTAVSSQSGEWNIHSVKMGDNTFPSTHRNHPIRKATQQSLWGQTQSKLPLHENAILPTIESVEQLFRTLHAEIPMLTKGQLTWFCNLNTDSQPIPYVTYSIPKKSGGERQISVPHPILKQIQYWILKNILYAVPVHVAAHGFVPNRSIFTNAQVHMSPRLLLNMDLKDFFPSIGFLRVLRIFSQLGYAEPIANILAFLCTTSQNGSSRYLPQGAPTSPALSNLAAWTLDQRLSHFCQQYQLRYTRYADDISISDSMDAKRRHSFGWVQKTACKIIESAGFALHPTKTRILSSGHRQEVTGLVVNHSEHHSSPRVSREYRSALYQEIQAGDVDGSINGKIAFVRQAQPDKADYLDSIKK